MRLGSRARARSGVDLHVDLDVDSGLSLRAER